MTKPWYIKCPDCGQEYLEKDFQTHLDTHPKNWETMTGTESADEEWAWKK